MMGWYCKSMICTKAFQQCHGAFRARQRLRYSDTDRLRHSPQAIVECGGGQGRLTIIVFTLYETSFARKLASLAGMYPALKLSLPWWFHDSTEGMRRFRETVTETAGFYNTVRFNDNTRTFFNPRSPRCVMARGLCLSRNAGGYRAACKRSLRTLTMPCLAPHL
jgi:hypothetical protein